MLWYNKRSPKNANKDIRPNAKGTPGEWHLSGGSFVLTCPCRACQATCKCSSPLHSLRQTPKTRTIRPLVSPPSHCWDGEGQQRQHSTLPGKKQQKPARLGEQRRRFSPSCTILKANKIPAPVLLHRSGNGRAVSFDQPTALSYYQIREEKSSGQ